MIDVLYRDNKKTIAMNISNTGHMIATKIEYGINFFLLTDSIGAISDVSPTSSHVTNTSSTRLFIHVKSFRYSRMSQSLSHSQAHMLAFPA